MCCNNVKLPEYSQAITQIILGKLSTYLLINQMFQLYSQIKNLC